MASPIILTLQLDAASDERFQSARDRWFPPKLNRVPAHLTLFHHLPGEERDEVVRLLAESCARRAPFPVSVAEVIGMGAGVAVRLRSSELEALRAELAGKYKPWLTAQDRQGFRAHVTLQNKVTKATAEACRREIEEGFSPWEARAEGVQIWSYEGGPWGTLGAIGFGGAR